MAGEGLPEIIDSEAWREQPGVFADHGDSVERLTGLVQRLYCPNLHTGYPFAVAAAYRHWSDVSEAEVVAALQNCVQFAGRDLL